MGMSSKTKVIISRNIVQLFQGRNYEPYVLEIINSSNKIFEGAFISIESQSAGEPDYVDSSGQVFLDAKLPFETAQVKMLTDGKRHAPLVGEWLNELSNEASHMNIDALRAGSYDVSKNKLYRIMFNQIKSEIEKEKKHNKTNKESIVFLMPFLIGHSYKGVFGQISDCLDVIYDQLAKEEELDYLNDREIYVINPTGMDKKSFVLRNLSKRQREYIEYSGFIDYFSYERLHS